MPNRTTFTAYVNHGYDGPNIVAALTIEATDIEAARAEAQRLLDDPRSRILAVIESELEGSDV